MSGKLRNSWPDYRAVWRWHFYAGMFCTPFVIVLAVSGSLYLFKTEIEGWIDRPYDSLTVTGTPASAADQVRSAMSAHPGSVPASYELPTSPQSAVRVIVNDGPKAMRVYVHPETLGVLQSVPEDERLMRILFRLHGELLMGDRGSNIVELAASWTIIMIVTGLFLWWPRQARGAGGILYPRLFSGSRIFWRDLHSVTGVWISTLALFLLLTGLPWAKFWGNYLKTVRQLTGTAVAQQDWTTGSNRSSSRGKSTGTGDHAGHSSAPARRETASIPKDFDAFDRIATTVRPLNLDAPVVIAPPRSGSGPWTAKSVTPNRPRRVNLTLDGATGDILSREDFQDRHLIDRIIGTGIAAHEGRLFGWANQALGVLTAAGLVLLCVSGIVMWWRRRDVRSLGAPRPLLSPRFSIGLAGMVMLLAILLPMFGASLLAVLILEKAVLRNVPGLRDWLGLRQPEVAAEGD